MCNLSLCTGNIKMRQVQMQVRTLRLSGYYFLDFYGFLTEHDLAVRNAKYISK